MCLQNLQTLDVVTNWHRSDHVVWILESPPPPTTKMGNVLRNLVIEPRIENQQMHYNDHFIVMLSQTLLLICRCALQKDSIDKSKTCLLKYHDISPLSTFIL
jgi:hypothetical protein